MFRINKDYMLFNRLGPIGAQKQKHRKGNTAPVRRGIWCLPWPINDPFLYSHQYTKQIPKKYRQKNRPEDEQEASIWWNERDEVFKKIIKRNRLKTIWWNKPFYSHLHPTNKKIELKWYLYKNARQFANRAKSDIKTLIRSGDLLYPLSYTVDHLEVFLPMVPFKEMPEIIY